MRVSSIMHSMDKTTTVNIVTFVSALLTLGGVSGITSQDISGFLNVIFGIITLGGIAYSHFTHKKALAAVTTPAA